MSTSRTEASWFLSSVTSASDSASVLFSFQFPTTIGVRDMAGTLSSRSRDREGRPADLEQTGRAAVLGVARVAHRDRRAARQLHQPLQPALDHRAGPARAGSRIHDGRELAGGDLLDGELRPAPVAAPQRAGGRQDRAAVGRPLSLAERLEADREGGLAELARGLQPRRLASL